MDRRGLAEQLPRAQPGGAEEGDGQPGGSFTARFTVDSVPEIGTYYFGAAYVDINGNGTFDPDGAET